MEEGKHSRSQEEDRLQFEPVDKHFINTLQQVSTGFNGFTFDPSLAAGLYCFLGMIHSLQQVSTVFYI